ncbi:MULTISPECIES: tautomerase family protein [unclassified Spirosoma]|uniref:tautomerase family protein n=1 Tax=unclassified Spirosoma TaxID=2621999 RepID=UPI00096744F6|nr:MULTISPECIES: tautomerase family protein [unclassified Spirosoma]MBN8824678.1 tautomerase family protein [Spirosoma sp.]OJW78776.1 MAG: tautomerase family protein [Spirosoma sp. 48-14]
MSQVKIYGVREHLLPIREVLSDTIHACVVEALQFPENKRAHRFFYLDKDDFFRPATASERYIILEFMMIEGRTVDTKKRLIRLLYERVCTQLNLPLTDLEICILESPAHNWGFRGMTGDEITLNYKVNV